MGKKTRSQRKESSNSKRRGRDKHVVEEDMDDEIDAFHKQRDLIPLDLNEDVGELDEDNETPVLDFKDVSEDEDDDENEDDDDISDDTELPSVAAKIARTQKFLRAKFGGVEDEMHDEEDEGKEGNGTVWGGKKSIYYEDSEVSSSEEEEEEAEVVRQQKERAKTLSMEDFGLEDGSQDEDEEPTLEDLAKGKSTSKSAVRKEAEDDGATAYEEVKKDLNSLSKEEQMDVVHSSAPELVGLLSELNDSVGQLESINLLISKVKGKENTMKGGMRYLEVKQLLVLSYCQAITFYLLLKSEGQPVRDHPIIARLVEIKSLLDKMKELDGNLPSELDEILDKYQRVEMASNIVGDDGHDSFSLDHQASEDRKPSHISAKKQEDAVLVQVNTLNINQNKEEKRKHQNEQVGVQSMEMLKLRAALEEKLKKKGVFNDVNLKPKEAHKLPRPVATGKLETFDDFDDDAMDVDALRRPSNGDANSMQSMKFARLVAERNKGKIVSGDDDLPKRDDIGERRRKHELRVLASAGVQAENDVDDEVGTVQAEEDIAMEEESESGESEDELYREVKKQRTAKLAEKAEIYSRTSSIPSLPEVVDGKRHITQQIEKNRGLTRNRKKLNKNPRKKYRSKHQKAVVRRKGQVRDVRKATGPYGGEATGINAAISRSVRFKS